MNLKVAVCWCVLVVGLIVVCVAPSLAQDDVPAKSRKVEREPRPLSGYKGRRIAQTMHYTGAEWLTRDNREQEERCSLMLANLGVESGMTICEIGWGTGFYAVQMAKMVGEGGQVYGVDIQPEMLTFLQQR